ncbi:MAG: 50S ribosomal protein L25 [Clostridia bacterium]
MTSLRKDDKMQKIEISGIERTVKRGCNRLRNNGFLPGILYGENQKNIPVVFNKSEVEMILRKRGENALFEVSIDKETKPVMVKEIQRDPLTREPIHIDLQLIHKDRKVSAEVPIRVKGISQVERKGGIVQHHLNRVEVEGFSDDIPPYISVNASQLFPGQSLLVSHLEIASEISILTPGKEVILTVLNGEKQSKASEREEVSLEEKAEEEA